MGHSIRYALTILMLFGLAACGGGPVSGEEGALHFYGPTEMAMEPRPKKEDGAYLFVINSAGGDLTILNTLGYGIIRSHTFDLYDEDAIFLGSAPVDIAITPDDEVVYVTDANEDLVRTVGTQKPFEVNEVDLRLRAARVSIVPAIIDPQTFDPVIPAAWDERHEVWFAEPYAQRLVCWDHQQKEIVSEIDLPSEPLDLQVSRDGELVFVTTRDGVLRLVEAPARRLSDTTVELGGEPHRIVESLDEDLLFVLNANPAQLHLIDMRAWEQTDDLITFPMSINDMGLSIDGRLGFITSDSGYVYYFFMHRREACGSYADQIFFYDAGQLSDPTIENIQTADCITADETWMVTYRQVENVWKVEGTVSGVQEATASSGQTYIADEGQVQFRIEEGQFHSSDGDQFRFTTHVTVAPIPVGMLPRSAAVTPYQNELAEDLVFIANTGNHDVSVIYTLDQENLGAIQ